VLVNISPDVGKYSLEIGKYSSDVGKYSFLNTTIKSWNQLPAGLLAYFPCKINTFRKTVKNVVTSKGIQVGNWGSISEVMWSELTWFLRSDFILKWSEMKWVTWKFLGQKYSTWPNVSQALHFLYDCSPCLVLYSTTLLIPFQNDISFCESAVCHCHQQTFLISWRRLYFYVYKWYLDTEYVG